MSAVPGFKSSEGMVRALRYSVDIIMEKGQKIVTQPGSALPLLENGVPVVELVEQPSFRISLDGGFNVHLPVTPEYLVEWIGIMGDIMTPETKRAAIAKLSDQKIVVPGAGDLARLG